MDTKDPEGNTAAHYWARGGMWFLIWLGFGGCCMLSSHSGPLVEIKTEAPASSR
jgi:hypothetical protein